MKSKVSKPYLITCQMVKGGPLHVYQRFCNPDERDRVLARDRRRAAVNWMNLQPEDKPLPEGHTPAVRLGTAELAGQTIEVYSHNFEALQQQHLNHWN